MEIVGGPDLHRRQITFDVSNVATGEVSRGQIRPVTRPVVRDWLGQFNGHDSHFAVEATTGWWFVVDEIGRAGMVAHLAEPAETTAAKGRKKRAKTDRTDARHLRDLVIQNRLPAGAAWLLSAALSQIDQTQAQLEPLDRWLRGYARRQAGCRALIARHYGVGELIAPTILAELGDVRRFANGAAVVRHTGLDITVYSSDGKRSPGRLSRQGPQVLRWALYEAAKNASRRSSPDHDYYTAYKRRRDGRRATLAVARKLVRRIRHTLLALGEDALTPPNDLPALQRAA